MRLRDGAPVKGVFRFEGRGEIGSVGEADFGGEAGTEGALAGEAAGDDALALAFRAASALIMVLQEALIFAKRLSPACSQLPSYLSNAMYRRGFPKSTATPGNL